MHKINKKLDNMIKIFIMKTMHKILVKVDQ